MLKQSEIMKYTITKIDISTKEKTYTMFFYLKGRPTVYEVITDGDRCGLEIQDRIGISAHRDTMALPKYILNNLKEPQQIEMKLYQASFTGIEGSPTIMVISALNVDRAWDLVIDSVGEDKIQGMHEIDMSEETILIHEF